MEWLESRIVDLRFSWDDGGQFDEFQSESEEDLIKEILDDDSGALMADAFINNVAPFFARENLLIVPLEAMKKHSATVYERIFEFLGVDKMDIQFDDRAKNVNPFAYSRLCHVERIENGIAAASNSQYNRIIEMFKPQVEEKFKKRFGISYDNIFLFRNRQFFFSHQVPLLQHLSAYYSHGIPQVNFAPVEEKFHKESFRVRSEMRENVLVYDLFLANIKRK